MRILLLLALSKVALVIGKLGVMLDLLLAFREAALAAVIRVRFDGQDDLHRSDCVGSVGHDALYTFDNDTGPDDANRRRLTWG